MFPVGKTKRCIGHVDFSLTFTLGSPVFEEDDLAVQWCKHLLIGYGDVAVVVVAVVVVGFAAADVAAVV